MSYGTTLFAHIALTKLQSQIEDTAVEALGYILTQSPAARRALTVFLSGEDFDIGCIHRVATWERDEKGAIPDLVCFDEYNSNHVLIEAKFFADLTKNQPNQYLRQLQKNRKNRPAALLFVAPESRLESLWPNLCERAREEKPEIELSIISDSGDLRSASISDGKHRLLLTSWAALLGSMETQACEDGDKVAVGDLKQLRGLTDCSEPAPYLPLHPEEMGPEFARRMEGLRRLIDDAIIHGKSAGFLEPGNAATGGGGGYGLNIELGGVAAGFGIEVFAWARYSSTPLWLRFGRDKLGQLKQAGLTDEMFDPGKTWDFRIPITFPAGVDYDELLSSVVSRLKSIERLFDPDSVADVAEDAESELLSDRSNRMDPFAFLPWRPEELEPEFAQKVTGLHRLIDDTISRGNIAGFLQPTKVVPKQEGYGHAFLLGDLKAWLGIHSGGWARHRDTPLWLTFEYIERAKQAEMDEDVFEIEGRYCVPIEFPAEAESEVALNYIIANLKKVASQLKRLDA